MRRIQEHPILAIEERAAVCLTVDGRQIQAREGDTVAAALLANGIRVFRHTSRFHEPRGLFCGIGQCTDCVMEVDGRPNVRTCVTRVRDGMVVRTQEGNGAPGEERHEDL
ncbi:(2Fe-2S)-binding protein [Pseudoflavonifractor sp. 524-17]|uniref:(2Fe-2S)-binding protein n=1 Tax=Pseudoflavonifractor sp. 524-17 TaxID=2304577 RepID=UPI0013798770|nr:(2Fe-2S)-binding protein [Pseudoflavonifractor sp. 524-17]NCE63968.1 (2Fe-2S)-binding protein [Pseudoflavonifractor sp. 524-17]